jgi:hypothetical protein
MDLSRRRILTAFALGTFAVQGTGCIGSFGLFNKVLDWNKHLSGNKFVNWLVFALFFVVQVYELTLVFDIFINNSIEFWTGSSLIAGEPGAPGERRVAQLDADHILELERAADGRTVHLLLTRADGASWARSFRYGQDKIEVLDGEAPIAEVSLDASSALVIRGRDGELLASYSSEQISQAQDAFERRDVPELTRMARAFALAAPSALPTQVCRAG